MPYEADHETFSEICLLRLGRGGLHSELVRWIDNSSGHKMTKLFKNRLGAKIGYVAWGLLSDETLIRLIKINLFPTYQYEWEEGINHFIFDICYYGNGSKRLQRRDLHSIFPRDVDKVAYVRNGELRLLRKYASGFRRVGEMEYFGRVI